MPQFGMATRVKPAYDGQEKCIDSPDLHETEPGPHERPALLPPASAL
jgi:hypothetical protein